GLASVDLVDDPLDIGLGEDEEIRGFDSEARGAELRLSRRFFAGDVEDANSDLVSRACRSGTSVPGYELHPRVFQIAIAFGEQRVGDSRAARQIIRGLEQQRGFPDSRFSSDEHRASGDDPATQYAIELADPGRRARRIVGADLRQ